MCDPNTIMSHEIKSALSAYPSNTKQAKEKPASSGMPPTIEVVSATVETIIKMMLQIMLNIFMSFSLVMCI